MTESPPRSIRLFEALAIASIAFGMLHQGIVTDVVSMGSVVGAMALFTFILLVSRLRQNWARWVLAIMFVLGAALLILDGRAVFAVGYPLVTIAVTLLQVASVVLLFTPESSNWLRKRPSPADTVA